MSECPAGVHRCAESDKLALEGIELAVKLKDARETIARQREDLKLALGYVEGRIRRFYTEYTGEDAVEVLRERGTLVIDDGGKERPVVLLWRRLNASVSSDPR